MDRHWNLILANAATFALLGGLSGPLMQPPVNVLRLSLHPDGLAPRILNFAEWRAHLLARLLHDAQTSADAVLLALLGELNALPVPARARGTRAAPSEQAHIAVPLRLTSSDGPLNFISSTTVFGTAVDVTFAELTIEAFLPEDDATATAMALMVNRAGPRRSTEG